MTRFLRVAWLVVRKDLRVESRSKEMLFTTLFFAVSTVLVFAFGFVRGGQAIEGAAPGILWIAIAFSGTLALGRAFERERYHDALRGLLLAPVDRPAIYLGKLVGLGAHDSTGEIYSAVERELSQDTSRTCGSQRIFIVDCRMTHLDDDFALRQIVDIHRHHARDNLAVLLVDSKRFHCCSSSIAYYRAKTRAPSY